MNIRHRTFHKIEPQHTFIFHARRWTEQELARRNGRQTDIDALCPERFKAVTVAVIFREDGATTWGVGHCGRHDYFSRAIGRMVAVGRAKQWMERVAPVQPSKPVEKKAAIAVAEQIAVDYLKSIGSAEPAKKALMQKKQGGGA